MSLINEALKKAQMEGGGKSAPAVRNPDVSSAALKARRPKVALFAVIGVAVAVAGGVGYYVMMPDEPAPVVVRRVPKVARVEPDIAAKPAVQEALAVVNPEAAPAPAAEVKSVAVEAPAPSAPEAVAPAATVARVAAVAPPPVRDPDVEDALGRMNLSLGRKQTGRCVIDGSVYKIGDRVSLHPVIEIKGITDSGVIFSDGNGVEYEKKYK